MSDTLTWLRKQGVPAWIVQVLRNDPTILAAKRPAHLPIVYTRTNGCRLAEWLVAELAARGHVVNATPSEYPDEAKT